jgi:hypothetical protein
MADDGLQSHQPGDSVNSPHRHWLLSVRLALGQRWLLVMFVMFLLRHLPLRVRLTLVKAVHVMFLLLWRPRYDSLAAARRASGSLPTAGQDEEFTLKDEGACQSGQVGRPLRPSRRRRRLGRRHLLPRPLRRSKRRRRPGRRRPVYFLATAGAMSTLIVLLSVVVMIVTWHPGGWI